MSQAPQAPQAPQGPQAPQASKGMFTNAVRSVANAMTGGALNRQIAEEQRRAVNQQANESQSEIREARNAQQQAEQAQIAAEREAERARDRRSMEAVDGVDVVRGRTIWNIQPGEIARKISERELDEIEKLKGIIVQDGCTAIIFANGELVSTLSAGAYLFYKSVEEEQAAIKNACEEASNDSAADDVRRKCGSNEIVQCVWTFRGTCVRAEKTAVSCSPSYNDGDGSHRGWQDSDAGRDYIGIKGNFVFG